MRTRKNEERMTRLGRSKENGISEKRKRKKKREKRKEETGKKEKRNR